MRRLIPAVLALAVTACAGTPEHAWQPTDPSFGRDQAVSEQAFCGVLFEGLAQAADNTDDRRVLTALRDSTIMRLERLGASPSDPDFRSGVQHAAIYVRGANAEQIVAAGERCIQIAMVGK